MPVIKVSACFESGQTYNKPTALELFDLLVTNDLIPPHTFHVFKRMQTCNRGSSDTFLGYDGEIVTITKE